MHSVAFHCTGQDLARWFRKHAPGELPGRSLSLTFVIFFYVKRGARPGAVAVADPMALRGRFEGHQVVYFGGFWCIAGRGPESPPGAHMLAPRP
jgi:hypothetical protein